MKKIVINILIMMLGCIGINAQTSASAYIDNVISSIKESDGINAQFVLQGDYNSGQYLQGTLKMRGKKFCLTTNDMTSWYDGKTMWSYSKSIDEVNITEPTQQELMEINPYTSLENYKQIFTVAELKSERNGERRFMFTPTKRNTYIKSVVITISTAQMAPILFEITNTQDVKTVITITNYNNKANLPASTFTFDATKYPNTSIIDLR